MFEAATTAARLEHDRAMQVAWTMAALARVKKMPPLADLLSPAKASSRRKAMAWQDMLKVAEAWAA